MLTTAYIILVAWSGFVLTIAMHHGRRPGRLQRWARAIGIFGSALVLPVLVLGSFGVPVGWSFRWLGSTARLATVGLSAAIGGAVVWLVGETGFVWVHRRRIFPFAFRGDPTGNPVSEPPAPR